VAEPGNTVLLVEDDARLAGLISEFLRQEGYEVSVEPNGRRAVDRILAEQPGVVILDWMLPGEDGLSICRRIRPGYGGPVLMLSARGDEIDQVLGLEMGADDYVQKPVTPRLLLARLRAIRRRTTPSALFVDGDLVLDPGARSVTVGGQTVDLTTGEYDVLWLLASSAGTVRSREHIIEALRGIAYDGLDRSIDVRISKLRQKLGDDPRHPERIKTVRGLGYLYARKHR
jgi:two-component system response regulator RstA